MKTKTILNLQCISDKYSHLPTFLCASLYPVQDFFTRLHDDQLLQKYAEYLEEKKKYLFLSKMSIQKVSLLCQHSSPILSCVHHTNVLGTINSLHSSLMKMVQNLLSSKMAKMLSTTDIDNSVPKGVILPDTAFRELWDILALAAVVIFSITIPYQISFSDESITLTQFILDSFLDVFFIADVYARMARFAVTKDGSVVTSPREFRRIYLKNEFRTDFFSIIPASTFAYFFGKRDHTYGLMRLIQLTRLRRTGKFISSFVETFESRMNLTISTAFLRVLQMVLGVVMICHWFACIFHFIGDFSNNMDNWLIADESIEESMDVRYLRSFYWALYTGE